MKTPPRSIHILIAFLALVLGLSAGSAAATTFAYSYTFGDGQMVTGKLDGTQNGEFVDNVANVSILFNGVELTGPVFTAKYYDGVTYLNGPVVSFDALKNNFVFVNSDLAADDWSYDSLFYILNASVYQDTAVAYSASLNFAAQDFPTVSPNWTLGVAPASVPDSGSTALFLGLAILAIAWEHRKTLILRSARISQIP